MPRLSDAELRKFGLTVGVALAVLGAVSWWRGHEVPPKVLWTVAGLLVVPALLLPRALGPVQHGWMAFAEVLGRINTRIILTALFYAVITPIAVVLRMFRDPLRRSLREPEASQWVRRSAEDFDTERYERQF